ncbi:Arm DNA-binding domain-containing protein [Niabella ginsengisoli]|uniref:Arm DNA-binding domain-containing protein n=1 Tax=Niabella ginsengisoli TaxID=522298 RepID=UPI00374CFA8A
MSLPIKLICCTNRVLRDGSSSIFVQYCYDEKHKPLFSTGIKIPASCWNKQQRLITAQHPLEYGNYKTPSMMSWQGLKR